MAAAPLSPVAVGTRPNTRGGASATVRAMMATRGWNSNAPEGLTMVSINEEIREYMGRGWSIIPIRAGDKRPLVRWEEFQHRHPSEAEVRGWFRQWPEAGIGVVTGAISGLVVVDVDAGHGGTEALEQLEREHRPTP